MKKKRLTIRETLYSSYGFHNLNFNIYDVRSFVDGLIGDDVSVSAYHTLQICCDEDAGGWSIEGTRYENNEEYSSRVESLKKSEEYQQYLRLHEKYKDI